MVLVASTMHLPLLQRASSYDRLMRISAWMFRFVENGRRKDEQRVCGNPTVQELGLAENSGGERSKNRNSSSKLQI